MRNLIVLALLMCAAPSHAADTLGKMSVRTAAKTDVQTQLAGQDGATLGAIVANNTAQAGGGQWVLPAIVQSSLPTYSTNGNLVGLTVDASGRLYVTIDSTSVSGTNLKQVNGTTVDVNTGNASAGTQRVVLASNQPTVPVSFGAASGAATVRAAPVNVASAGTSTITCKGSLTVSTPTKAYRVRATGAAMARCLFRYTDNVTSTNYGDLMLSAAKPQDEITFPTGFAGQTTGTTGTQAWELSCTNFDSAAADIGCDISYCVAASGC